MTSRRLLRLLAALFAFALLAAACGDDGDDGDDDAPGDDTSESDDAGSTTSEAPSTTAAVPEGGEEISGVAITEVVFGDDGHVTLRNDGADEVSLDGLALCNRPVYTDLTGTLAPGETTQVPALELGGLSIDGGEAALYSSQSFSDPTAMLDYVTWGDGGGRSTVAVEAGLWDEGVTVEPNPEFGSIERFDISGGPGAWE